MEELFFFQYYMYMPKEVCLSYPIHERKWLIRRFVEQKNKENEAMEKAKNKNKKGKR